MAKKKMKKGRKAQDQQWKFYQRFKEGWQKKKMIIIYSLSFILLIIFFAWIGDQEFFQKISDPLLSVYANISSGILNIFGQGTKSIGDVISSSEFSITIKKGCDAIAPMALYIVAILAFPISKKYKWQGIVFGVLFLFVLNVIRIISLYLIGAYANHLFDFAHVQLWQVIFIILTVLLWIYWLKWANQKQLSHDQA